jgi:endonuclease YncB( thermonuclease family)
LVFGKVVTIKVETIDQYGRTVGEVILPDGRNLNHELVSAGFAWWYREYSKDEILGRLEAEATAAKRGLWADPHPIPPWEFRKLQKTLR